MKYRKQTITLTMGVDLTAQVEAWVCGPLAYHYDTAMYRDGRIITDRRSLYITHVSTGCNIVRALDASQAREIIKQLLLIPDLDWSTDDKQVIVARKAEVKAAIATAGGT